MARPAKPSPPPIDHAVVPWLLATALATAAPHASHLPVWLTLFGACVLSWRIWLWHVRGPLPSRWLLGLLIVAGSAGIGWEYRTLFGRDSGVALLFFFMALKPMEMRSRRDALVIVMLGYFLLLTHYFFSQDIATGVWLLCAATLLTATLIRLHGSPKPPIALFRHAATLLLQALPFMLITFLLFPRIQGPLWGLPRDAYSGMTGLSDQMSPGSLNNLIQSGAIAFRVQFADTVPRRSALYWRGPVLVDYDGQVWRSRPFLPRTGGNATAPAIEAPGEPIRYTMTIEPHNQRWLLALDIPTSLPAGTGISPWLEARLPTPLTLRTRFAFTSITDFTVNHEESPALLQQALRLPPDINPRARALAATWRGQSGSPAQISDAALQLFRQEAFYYTLQPPLLGTNAIDDFLFGTRRGFCEHFAAAYVFLMRAAGIPARVVTGYQGGEINPIDGYFTVRQSDAHAWAEIWIAGRGWLRVDPTAAIAPSRIERGISAALPAGDPLPALVRLDTDWLRQLHFRWEALNNAWNQWILGYNPQRQREVLSRLGFGEPDWRDMTAAMAVLCGLALFIVTFWTLYQRRRETPAQRLWHRYCRRLERLGFERAPWEGPLALAERLAQQQPELGALTYEAAGHYAGMHYGSDGTRRLIALRNCVHRLEKWPAP